MDKIKVVIADDEKLIREGLKLMLMTYEDIDVIGTADNGYKALELCKNNSVDIVLMDIRMEVCDGVKGTRLIKEQFEKVKVLILTTFKDKEYIDDALHYGAFGYLLKDSSPEVIYNSIKSAYSGNMVIHPDVASKIIENQKDLKKGKDISNLNLSDRELKIICDIADGLTNKEIAEELYLSEGTVKNNISSILSKLKLRDRTQIAIFAFKMDLVK